MVEAKWLVLSGAFKKKVQSNRLVDYIRIRIAPYSIVFYPLSMKKCIPSNKYEKPIG
jgi:hypothetical protein